MRWWRPLASKQVIGELYIFVSSSCICELLFPTPVCPMNFDSSSPQSSLIRNVVTLHLVLLLIPRKNFLLFSSTYTSVWLQAGGNSHNSGLIYLKNVQILTDLRPHHFQLNISKNTTSKKSQVLKVYILPENFEFRNGIFFGPN